MQLSDFRILKQIDKHVRRKFGENYLVEHIQTQEKCILKKVSKNHSAAYLRLKNEGKYSFESKNLPQIVAFFEDEEQAVLIRKYIEGITLKELFFTKNRKKKNELLLQLLPQFENIFHSIHSQNIIHLDIRLENFIFNEVTHELSLIDFGFATNISIQEKRKTLFPLGTAAPELLLNEFSLVKKQTDYFSFGILIWQIFEEKLPLLDRNPSITTNLQLVHPLPESDLLSRKQNEILCMLTAKFAFKTAPNLLMREEKIKSLEKAIQNRYVDFETFIEDWKNAPRKKVFFC